MVSIVDYFRRGIWIIFILFFAVPAFPAPNTNTATGFMPTNGSTNASFLAEFYARERNTNITTTTQKASGFWSVVKLIIYTAIFGVLAYFVVKFIVSKSGLPATADDKIAEVLMVKPLGLGSYLQIVKIGPSYYLLGVSNEGVTYIDQINDKETIDYIELNKETLKPTQTKFADILKIFPPGKKVDRMQFMKDQKDKLKKM